MILFKNIFNIFLHFNKILCLHFTKDHGKSFFHHITFKGDKRMIIMKKFTIKITNKKQFFHMKSWYDWCDENCFRFDGFYAWKPSNPQTKDLEKIAYFLNETLHFVTKITYFVQLSLDVTEFESTWHDLELHKFG